MTRFLVFRLASVIWFIVAIVLFVRNDLLLGAIFMAGGAAMLALAGPKKA